MADWREKIKSISKTKGNSAPEFAKQLGMGCLGYAILAVSILTFIVAIGLSYSGNWVAGLFATAFFLVSAATAFLLIMPHKSNKL